MVSFSAAGMPDSGAVGAEALEAGAGAGVVHELRTGVATEAEEAAAVRCISVEVSDANGSLGFSAGVAGGAALTDGLAKEVPN